MSQSMHLFSFMRYEQTIFQGGCTNLHSHQLCMSVQVAPNPYPTLDILCFHFSSSDG